MEIDLPAIEEMAKKKRRIREFVDEYTLPGGHRVNLLGEGRLVNLAAAEGQPSSVMDMRLCSRCYEMLAPVDTHYGRFMW